MNLRTFTTARVLACCALLSFGALAANADDSTAGLRYPSLTPNGKHVVFSYRGDIWLANVSGEGPVARLTIHQAQDTLPKVSPDGKTIAFSSLRNGRYDIFTMPIEGGMPTQVTFHSGSEVICDWSPDGKSLLFVSERAGDTGRLDLYEVDLAGGTPRRITYDGAREGSYSPDGKKIVYVRGFNNLYWDNYEGSANYDMYIVDRAGGLPKRILKTDGNEHYPYFAKDNKTVYFVAEKEGVANFFKIAVGEEKPTQVTNYKKSDVHRPRISGDHDTVVFERVGKLYTASLSKPEEKPTPLPVKVRSDVRNSGLETRTITGGGKQVNVSYDGTQVVFTLRGDIWTMPASGGKGRQLTKGSSNEQWPKFSPNGKEIAYFSDRNGNNDIFLMDLKTGRSRQLTKSKANDHFHNWSPDGKFLVFCSERGGNKDIWKIDVETAETTQLTRHEAADDDPVVAPNGKMIAFDSGREGQQSIYVMNLETRKVRRVTYSPGFLQVPSFSPDSKMLVYETFSQTTGASAGLSVISVNGGPAMQISRDGQTACWSPKGDYIYFTADRGRRGNGVFKVRAPKDITAGEHVPFIGQVTVDLRKELEQLFDECWKSLGNGFYDKKMHGVDWNEMRKKYRDMAINAEDKGEFQLVIRQMLAELGASHLGIWGGSRSGNSVTPAIDANGYLGLEFETESSEEGTLKVKSILREGPADEMGLRVGDVVTRINGKKLNEKTNLDKVLAGTVNKSVKIRFKPFTEDGLGKERRAAIKPISFGQLRSLKYKNWQRRCRDLVKKNTEKNATFGYVHLDAMNATNLDRFRSAVMAFNRNKRIKGMILDVRFNGGGNIHNQLMSILFAKPLAKSKVRGGREIVQPTFYWNKPLVVLINERSFSDAEVFPYMVKTAGVGTIIGVPTAGGVIGTNNITLSDGSSFRIARVGFWGLDGTNLEGLGVKPDIVVEETPEDRIKQRDPQLLKAIEVLKQRLEGKPLPHESKSGAKAEAEAIKPVEKPVPLYEIVKELGEVKEAPANPTYSAKEGEWIKLKRALPNGQEIELKLDIIKITAEKITMEQSLLIPGREPRARQMERPRKKLMSVPEGLKAKGFVKVALKIRGRETIGYWMTGEDKEGSIVRWLVCPDLPANGMVRYEKDGELVLEVVDWSGADKLPKTVTVTPGKEAAPAKPEKPADKPAPKKKDAKLY